MHLTFQYDLLNFRINPLETSGNVLATSSINVREYEGGQDWLAPFYRGRFSEIIPGLSHRHLEQARTFRPGLAPALLPLSTHPQP